jgi:hypothetical protein
VTLALLFCVIWPRLDIAPQSGVTPSSTLQDLASIGQLQTAFDVDREKTRVVLLLSPT